MNGTYTFLPFSYETDRVNQVHIDKVAQVSKKKEGKVSESKVRVLRGAEKAALALEHYS